MQKSKSQLKPLKISEQNRPMNVVHSNERIVFTKYLVTTGLARAILAIHNQCARRWEPRSRSASGGLDADLRASRLLGLITRPDILNGPGIGALDGTVQTLRARLDIATRRIVATKLLKRLHDKRNTFHREDLLKIALGPSVQKPKPQLVHAIPLCIEREIIIKAVCCSAEMCSMPDQWLQSPADGPMWPNENRSAEYLAF